MVRKSSHCIICGILSCITICSRELESPKVVAGNTPVLIAYYGGKEQAVPQRELFVAIVSGTVGKHSQVIQLHVNSRLLRISSLQRILGHKDLLPGTVTALILLMFQHWPAACNIYHSVWQEIILLTWCKKIIEWTSRALCKAFIVPSCTSCGKADKFLVPASLKGKNGLLDWTRSKSGVRLSLVAYN